MKSATTGSISGCIIWIIVFGAISCLCIFPVVMVGGMLSSTSGIALKTVGPIICPDNTTTNVRTYATTTTDENGFSQPSTAYVLQCKDENGEVVKEDPVGYAFIWMGIITAIGLVLSGVLAFVFAAPAGVLIARLFNRIKNKNQIVNIEPR